MAKSASPKKTDSPKKKTSKKEQKPAAKNLREYSIASGLDKRLVPSDTKRTAKQPSRFTEEVKSEKKDLEVVIPKGKGKKLEDCEHIGARINKRSNKNELLHTVHNFVFHGRATKKTTVKDNLLSFKGIVYEEGKEKEYWEDRLSKLKKNTLKHLSAFFGLDPKGDREDLEKALLQFLEKPSESGEIYALPDDEAKKRKRSRSRSRSSSPARKKAKKEKKEGPKRPTSAYMYFAKDKRASVAKEHPDEKLPDISKRLGKMWKKLGADDKAKYEKLAKKDKKRYEEEKAKAEK